MSVDDNTIGGLAGLVDQRVIRDTHALLNARRRKRNLPEIDFDEGPLSSAPEIERVVASPAHRRQLFDQMFPGLLCRIKKYCEQHAWGARDLAKALGIHARGLNELLRPGSHTVTSLTVVRAMYALLKEPFPAAAAPVPRGDLKKIRELKKLHQADVAALVSVSRHIIDRLEKNSADVDAVTEVEVCRWLQKQSVS